MIARRALRPLLVTLALIFLAEAWLWDRLKPVVSAIVNVIPWGPVKLWLRGLIETLPPWATLIVFVVPVIVLFPVKLLGLWMLAHGYWFGAVATLVVAKLVGVGVAAFVFDVTREKLLQMEWFRWCFDRVMALRDWAHALVDPIKDSIKRVFRIFSPGRAGRAMKLFWRIRRRMHAAKVA